jgi:hypothetical protein
MGQFSLGVAQWVTAARGDVRTVVRRITLVLYRRVILRSPVDTGRFRGNWQCGIGSIPEGVLAALDPSGQAAVARMTAEVAHFNPGQVIILVNNLPYAIPLEYGHSKQAPGGMVRITVAEFGGVASEEAQRQATA